MAFLNVPHDGEPFTAQNKPTLSWRNFFSAVARGVSETTAQGPTSARPTSTRGGQPFFDETLNRPIWRNAANTAWILADGTVV